MLLDLWLTDEEIRLFDSIGYGTLDRDAARLELCSLALRRRGWFDQARKTGRCLEHVRR